MERRRAAGGTAAAALLLLTAAVGVNAAAAETRTPNAGHEALPPPGPAGTPSSTVTPAGIAAAVTASLAAPSLGPGVGATVVDAATGATLYTTAGAVPTIPASSQKIITAASVTAAVGPDTRVTTRAVRTATGLVLVGAGDSGLVDAADGRNASLSDLADRTVAALGADGGTAPVQPLTIGVDDSLFTGPATVASWLPASYEDCLIRPISALMLRLGPGVPCEPGADPALQAGRVFARLLAERGIPVAEGITRTVVASGSQEIAAVTSAPISEQTEDMLLASDNVAAEELGHLAGMQRFGQATFTGSVAAGQAILRDLGVPATGVTMVDASGLSRDNLVPATTIAATLSAVTGTMVPATWPTLTGLPVAGFNGSLADRFVSPAASPGRGEVRAKTGTLTGVASLSGLALTSSGQLLAFSFLSATVTDPLQARADLDAAAASLAACGCQGP